jgi:23S rRNA pseudouridine955/2504/2580 synthase
VKVNGVREQVDYMLVAGDEISLYLSDERIGELSRRRPRPRSKRQFGIVYEDERILVVSKPFGLLTHGDRVEKKDTLVNQVSGYLLDSGYDGSFTPSPVNRLDRNTTGIVVFGKDPKAVRDFSAMIRHGSDVDKYYITLAVGEIKDTLDLRGRMVKDEETNTVQVLPASADAGRETHTIIRPLRTLSPDRSDRIFTLAEVLLVTGRSHQIRADLAAAGHPVIGDRKYGDPAVNRYLERKLSLPAQFLHASRMHINKGHESLEYLAGMDFESPLPQNLNDIIDVLDGKPSPMV